MADFNKSSSKDQMNNMNNNKKTQVNDWNASDKTTSQSDVSSPSSRSDITSSSSGQTGSSLKR